MNHNVTRAFMFCVDRSSCCVMNYSVTRTFLFSVDRSPFSVMNHKVTRAFLFCVDRSPCSVMNHIVTRSFLFCFDSTTSQELFCSVLTELLVLCYEPQCHKNFSVLFWKKSLFCVMNHGVTTAFLFSVDRSPCSVLWTTVSQEFFGSVLTEVLVLCYELKCHKDFSFLCWRRFLFCYEIQCHKSSSVLFWQKSLFCVMNHSVISLFILRSVLNFWPPIYVFIAENKC